MTLKLTLLSISKPPSQRSSTPTLRLSSTVCVPMVSRVSAADDADGPSPCCQLLHRGQMPSRPAGNVDGCARCQAKASRHFAAPARSSPPRLGSLEEFRQNCGECATGWLARLLHSAQRGGRAAGQVPRGEDQAVACIAMADG